MNAPTVRPSPVAPQRPDPVRALTARVASLEKMNAGLFAALGSILSGPTATVSDVPKNLADIRSALGETHPLYRQVLHAEATKLVKAGAARDVANATAQLVRIGK